jgi:hypothetical protein
VFCTLTQPYEQESQARTTVIRALTGAPNQDDGDQITYIDRPVPVDVGEALAVPLTATADRKGTG